MYTVPFAAILSILLTTSSVLAITWVLTATALGALPFAQD